MKVLLANSPPNQSTVPYAFNELDCHGHDLRGCPTKDKAVFETKSDRIWKRGIVWIFICRKCAALLLK